jgi:hypothetical protein
MAIVKIRTQKQLQQKFKPYAVELGKLVYSWNRLQEGFAILFWWLTANRNHQAALAAWYSVQDDRRQRGMLKAAIQVLPESSWEGRKNAKTEIEWAIKNANEFAIRRNSAIHSPYTMQITEKGAQLIARGEFGNLSAQMLKDRNLFDEFRWCAGSADVLHQYLISILDALMFSEHPWPDRPQLPTRGQKAQSRPNPRKTK